MTNIIPKTIPTKQCTLCGEPGTQTHDEITVCDGCHARIADYQDKLNNRLERLQAWSDRLEKTAHADLQRARDMASIIPFGQPILVGHHSEKRDRNYRQRIENTFRRGFEALQRAERAKTRLNSAESNRAISSDDPLAVVKLRERIAELETSQDRWKIINKAVRKALSLPESGRTAYLMQELDTSEMMATEYLTPDFVRRTGIPSYRLTNNNANIKRLKARLDDLERQNRKNKDLPDLQTSETDIPGLTIQRDSVDNRIRLIFDHKPGPQARAYLKARGFRWSPAHGAWQRHLSTMTDWWMGETLKHLGTLVN